MSRVPPAILPAEGPAHSAKSRPHDGIEGLPAAWPRRRAEPAALKAWQRDPCPRRAAALRARFDRIFTRHTDYVVLDRLLARLHRRKAELLRVLQRPEIPLHTSGSENDIRACVTKRKVSSGTMSEDGRTARDVLLGLMKTCRKLGLSGVVRNRVTLEAGLALSG
jgi:Transposase IS66 family